MRDLVVVLGLTLHVNRRSLARATGPVFFVPPLMGGMVLATSKRTKDRKFPLGAYPSWPEGRVWW